MDSEYSKTETPGAAFAKGAEGKGTAPAGFAGACASAAAVEIPLAPKTLIGEVKQAPATQPFSALQGKVGKRPKTAAIILAGGSGERFGRAGGKQLVEVMGRPILTWSAEAFDAVADVGAIIIVCPQERFDEYLEKAIDPFPFVTPIIMAPSGPSRQESAFSGLEYVPEEYEFVALHDGARPNITPELIEHTINTLKGNIDADGALVAHPAVDTLKVVENGVVTGTPDRRVFWNAQTPQVFRAGIYRRAHASALSDGFLGTDDSSLIERLGGKVLVVQGKRDNIKMTMPEDFLMLSALVNALYGAEL